VNACGLIGGLRNKKDGWTYFGCQEKHPDTGEVTNDFLVPESEQGIGKRHFVIRYSIDPKMYYIKDLGEGTGTFVRLDVPLSLKSNYIISFGDSHMVVQIYNDTAKPDLTKSKIQLRFLDGPKTDQTFTFFEDTSKIKIGRMSDCDVKFDDNSLSRNQCSIMFEEGNWVLRDGDGKPSTNGTWLFVDEYFLIYDNMVFKAGQTLFRAHVLPVSN